MNKCVLGRTMPLFLFSFFYYCYGNFYSFPIIQLCTHTPSHPPSHTHTQNAFSIQKFFGENIFLACRLGSSTRPSPSYFFYFWVLCVCPEVEHLISVYGKKKGGNVYIMREKKKGERTSSPPHTMSISLSFVLREL